MSTWDPDFGPSDYPNGNGGSIHGDATDQIFPIICYLLAALFLAMAVWSSDETEEPVSTPTVIESPSQ